MTLGAIQGLFVDVQTGMGCSRRIQVGIGPRRARLGDESEESLEAARVSVAAWLEQHSNFAINPYAEPLSLLSALSVGDADELVDGSSSGLAFALAMISVLIRKPLRQDSYVTGQVVSLNNGLVLSNASELTPAKLAFAESIHAKQVIMPAEDVGGAVTSNRVVGVNTLSEAVDHAFGAATLDSTIRRAASRIAELQLRGLDDLCRMVCSGGIYRSGLVACGRDPVIFLALGLYFAFCAIHFQRCRSPDQWPKASDTVFLGGNDLGFQEFALAAAARAASSMHIEVDGAVRDARRALQALGREPGATQQPADALDTNSLIRWIQDSADRTPSVPAAVAAALSGADTEGRPAAYDAFVALVALFGEPGASDDPLLQILGRRRDFELKLGSKLNSLQDIADGRSIINATLGGAWLVPYAVEYLGAADPIRWPTWYRASFNEPRHAGGSDSDSASPSLGDLLGGLRESARRHGGHALFLEHPFGPRVLWEIIDGSNRRYPAEMLVVRQFFAEHGADSRTGDASVSWSYELLPPVGEFNGDYVRMHSQEWAARRIGEFALSDYAAFRRTNATNRFVLPPVLNDLDMAVLDENVWEEIGVIGRDVLRRSVIDPDEGGRPTRLVALNARSSVVATSEFLRRQLVLDGWLGGAATLEEVPVTELLSMPWTSLKPVNSPLDAYLWGMRPPPGDLVEGSSTVDERPIFLDPFTWRGIGLATLLAYQAAVGLTMLRVLHTRWADSRPGSQERTEYQLSLREVGMYACGEYLSTALPKSRQLVQRVLAVVDSDPGPNELHRARDQLARVEEALAEEELSFYSETLADV